MPPSPLESAFCRLRLPDLFAWSDFDAETDLPPLDFADEAAAAGAAIAKAIIAARR